MQSGGKRKRDEYLGPPAGSDSGSGSGPEPAPPLRIQAFEADLVRDRPNLAEAVEWRDGEGGRRGGLIRLSGEGDVWVDRFDVRLLLDTLPPSTSTPPHNEDPLADIGWSDLPSDSEDTFFLTTSEIAGYRHEKRKREMEQGRLDRLRALAEREGEEEVRDEDRWGASDEEPDEAQTNLMARTASHILASPNPAQLEMRILANHGADSRFAFLRGRWKRAWMKIKTNESHGQRTNESGGKEKMDGSKTDGEKKEKSGGIGGLAGYASESESDEGKGKGSEGEEAGPITFGGPTAPMSTRTDEDETELERVKAERRARALEWMRRRREGG
ncbi:hypothetical protein FRC12_003743 [Ceratobasidium sp. 428]|nr:hypothetical protein FRC12_003743 [Ceratobasidium sp. 428]